MTDEASPLDYAAALAEAQRLGYAEADPAGDVEGFDAVNKLVILARLAFDRWLDPATIPTRPDGIDGPAGPGITSVSLADQADARAVGRIIRLVASVALDARRGGCPRRRGPSHGAPDRLRARCDGRCSKPDRGRRDAGRSPRLRWPRSGRCGDVLGRPR